MNRMNDATWMAFRTLITEISSRGGGKNFGPPHFMEPRW
jgi:hypothetical protein